MDWQYFHSVFLWRSAGSFTGVAEGTFYAANLKNGVTISSNDTVCAQRLVPCTWLMTS